MKYFGTDGIRGIYGQTVTERLAFRIGLAAAYLCGEVIVASDTRESGESLKDALISGLIRGGATVTDIGIAPTPMVSYLCRKRSLYGIMITASHNPPEYNGFKFFMRDGYKPTLSFERSIENCNPLFCGGGKIAAEDATEEYCEYAAKGFNLSGRTITLDCAFGATSIIAPIVFEMAGAKVDKVCCDYNGSKINCDCGAIKPRFCGNGTEFAFDGDGDRVVMSADGQIVDGDSALYSLFCSLKSNGVVGTIMSNSALAAAVTNSGANFVATAVGDRAVAHEMKRTGYTLGGEKSGHYIIMPNRSGDGICAALHLASCEIKRLNLVPSAEFSVSGGDAEEAIRKFSGCDARIVIRRSGTEPKVRVMVECESEDGLNKICGDIKDFLEGK